MCHCKEMLCRGECNRKEGKIRCVLRFFKLNLCRHHDDVVATTAMTRAQTYTALHTMILHRAKVSPRLDPGQTLAENHVGKQF